MSKKPPRITKVHPVDEGHQVVTIEGGNGSYRREPCPGCPWRVDQTGEFPAGAFKVSAPTAYDMAQNVFSCHESGAKKPATCAGFLLRGADNSLAVRLGCISGKYDLRTVSDGGHELHDDYRSMAVANGVDPADPVLGPCR